MNPSLCFCHDKSASSICIERVIFGISLVGTFRSGEIKWFIPRNGRSGPRRRALKTADPASCLWALYRRRIQRNDYLAGSHVTALTSVRVLARVFVTELMVGSGATESIIPAERRRGKKLWFRVHRGSTRDRISRRAKSVRARASGLLRIKAGILEHMLSALCSRKALGEGYRLLDRPENMRMVLLFVRSHFSRHFSSWKTAR